MQLLVARARGSERELLDAVPGKAGVGMTVDETRYRREPTPVELFHLARERRELAHRADLGDAAVLTDHERVVDDIYVSEGRAPSRRFRASRGCELGQIADQKAWWRRRRGGHVPPPGTDGRSIPLARASWSASS